MDFIHLDPGGYMFRRNLVLAVSAVAGALVLAGGGSAGSLKYHPPVVSDFAFACDDAGIVDNRLTACLGLLSAVAWYPQYAKTGITVRVVLYLPTGTRIVKSHITKGVPPGVPTQFNYPASNFRFRMIKGSDGVVRPVWVFRHNTQGDIPNWKFTMTVSPDVVKICIGAVARAPSVKLAPPRRTKKCYTRE